MSETESFTLDDICRHLRKICKEEEEKASRKSYKGIHAKMTKILAKYKDLRMLVENDNAPLTEGEIEQYRTDFIRGLMENREENVQHVLDEDQARRIRNRIQLKDIDNAIRLYETSCCRSTSEEKKRQFRTLHRRFLEDNEWTVTQIAEAEGVVERTTQRDLSIAIDEVAFFLRPDSDFF